MSVTTIVGVSASGREMRAEMGALLTPARRDLVREEGNCWIKSLRSATYGDRTMRERFMYRGDSLWWFTELYLHKMQRLETAIATVLALDAARETWSPARIRVETTTPASRAAAIAFGHARGLPVDLSDRAVTSRRHPWTGHLIGLSARLSRLRPAPRIDVRSGVKVAAFVHTAFWRGLKPTASTVRESYVGPVIDAVQQRLGMDDVALVGLGPSRNFRARRWFDPLWRAVPGTSRVVPIERLAPRSSIAGALDLWRRRRQLANDIVAGDGIRAAATVRGCNLWDVLAPELRDAALLQWPWSARAMDEAAATLEALTPGVAVTYAEAGGWGRAVVLEARRCGVPSVGLQHGFIYRHWLNYVHEPDEMTAVGTEAGFPRPTRTLLFDRFAGEYLERAGHFPPESLAVTGSATLDDLAARMAAIGESGRAAMRRTLGMSDEDRLLVLVAKFAEIRSELPALVAALGAIPSARLVIKPHPAETGAIYEPAASRAANVSIASDGADLAALLAASDGIVTMNSTVAIDGLTVGLPALVVGLPNNLSPFVDAGVMLGANAGTLAGQLRALLYDRAARDVLHTRAGEFTARYAMRSDGQAAGRAADEILGMIAR